MRDRVPQKPGVVALTPLGGDLYKMERRDEPTQVGTPINKATLLTDATAAKFGLGAEATPDEVFHRITNALFLDAPDKPFFDDFEGWRVETPLPSNEHMANNIAHQNGVYVVFATQLNNTYTYSKDSGRTWMTAGVPNATSDTASICAGNGIFILSYLDGKLFKSENGVTWLPISSLQIQPATSKTHHISFANGRFIFMQQSKLYTSSDGEIWELKSASAPEPYFLVDYGSKNYVGFSIRYTVALWYSVDLINWKIGSAGESGSYSGVAYGDGTFIATFLSYPSTVSYLFISKDDGVTWTKKPYPKDRILTGIIYDEYSKRFVIGGHSMGIGYSIDKGSTWEEVSFGDGSASGMAFDKNSFVAIAFPSSIIVHTRKTGNKVTNARGDTTFIPSSYLENPISIETGFYVGNGGVGSASPCTLFLPFSPIFFMVTCMIGVDNAEYFQFNAIKNQPTAHILFGSAASQDTNRREQKITWLNSGVSWYASGYSFGVHQMNDSEKKYTWLAIG